jgi:hypothetical protein
LAEEEERSGTTLQTEEPTRMSSFIDEAEKGKKCNLLVYLALLCFLG